jgi:hypothetical protein
VIGGDLNQDDLDAIGALDPHFDQAPGLRCGPSDDRGSGRSQPGVPGVDIPYQVAVPQKDPAAQNVHATISAARCVTPQVKENARRAAAMRGHRQSADVPLTGAELDNR